VDLSREADLIQLNQVINDQTDKYTYHQKRRARRTTSKILKKIHDPYLKDTRMRLIRATRANDIAEINKISDTLQEYERRTYGL